MPTYLIFDNASSCATFFLLPTNKWLLFCVQPWIFMNSSNSSTLLLQHVHPLLPSWNDACPGWYTQSSSPRDKGGSAGEVALQPRRRQVVFGGIGIEGSSESDSGGARDGAAGGVGWDIWGTGDFWMLLLVVIGFGGGITSFGLSGSGAVEVWGVLSTVECFPVVQGGIERNSSNVKNRGLQHCQPMSVSQPMCLIYSDKQYEGAQTPFCPS